MSVVVAAAGEKFDTRVPLIIVGAGAAGLCAALSAKEAGIDAIIVERDDVPAGSTALSAGLIPAADTRFQREKGITDSPAVFAADIQRKAKDEADPAIVDIVTARAGPLIEWLADRYGLPFEVVDNFNYPGHSAMRMHGLPSRTGRELIDRLRNAAETSDIVILAKSTAQRLFADSESRICGVEIARRDGSRPACVPPPVHIVFPPAPAEACSVADRQAPMSLADRFSHHHRQAAASGRGR